MKNHNLQAREKPQRFLPSNVYGDSTPRGRQPHEEPQESQEYTKPEETTDSASEHGEANLEVGDENTSEPNIETPEEVIEPQFHLFPRLAPEIRQRIWGFAVPDPVFVIQRRVIRRNRKRLTYKRKAPSILQACKDSRREFLDFDTNNPFERSWIESRRALHAVYKQYFKPTDRRFRYYPVYFSCEIDTFYGIAYRGRKQYDEGTTEDEKIAVFWSGITELDVASRLKHLCKDEASFHQFNFRPETPSYYRMNFPSLETLTILVKNCNFVDHLNPVKEFMLAYPPPYKLLFVPPSEVDGQIDIANLIRPWKDRVEVMMNELKRRFGEEQAKYPDWKMPVVKLRFKEQVEDSEDIGRRKLTRWQEQKKFDDYSHGDYQVALL